MHDPGGKSYGIYQLASKTNALKDFIAFLRLKAQLFFENNNFNYFFDSIEIASQEFDEKWCWLAKQLPLAFAKIQHEFIASTHFDPLIQFLTDRNIALNDITPAIKEALWSLGVQHRKALIILEKCYSEFSNIQEEELFIKNLYQHRTNYVNQLTILNETMKRNISKRYEKECAEIIATLIKPTN